MPPETSPGRCGDRGCRLALAAYDQRESGAVVEAPLEQAATRATTASPRATAGRDGGSGPGGGNGEGHAAASRAAGKSMAPDRSASPRMMPATPASRSRRDRRRGRRRRRPRGCRRRTTRTSGAAARRPGSAPPCDEDEPADAPATSSATSASSVGGDGASPGERGQPLGPRIEPDRQPVAGDREAGAQRSGRRRRDIARTTRVAPAAKASRISSAPSSPPASWSGTATRDGDRADRLEVRRRARARAVEVDEVDDPGALLHEPLGDPLGSIGRVRRRRPRRRARRRPASARPRGRSPG